MHYMILGEGELLSGRGCQAGVFCHNMMIQGEKVRTRSCLQNKSSDLLTRTHMRK